MGQMQPVAPSCWQCSVIYRMPPSPTPGIGRSLSTGTAALFVHISTVHSQQPYDEGPLVTLLFHQMSAEEGKFLLQSHSGPCKQGVKPASLQTH